MFNYLYERYRAMDAFEPKGLRQRIEYWLLCTFYKERKREAAELRYLRRRVDTLTHTLRFKERQVEALLKKALEKEDSPERLSMVELPDAPQITPNEDAVFEMSDEEFLRMKP